MLCVAHALNWGRKALASVGLAAASGLLFSQPGVCADGPLVVTDAGAVQGLSTPTGSSYLGIPYAAPPLGPLRWKAPAPAQAWRGVRPATTAGQACKQDGTLPPAGVSGSGEDCLYLNVHVPAQAGNSGPLPVMVWIHGGQFLTGAGAQYDGGELARAANVIVVTLNYRLGIFGLLALDALSAEQPAGNYALQDQQAALRWVKRNIGAFGGDAGKVTIFGQSAGSAGVCQQLVSPGAAGLFHRAIAQSGPCTAATGTREHALATGNAFARTLGCAAGPAQLACLRSKSADEVLAAAPTLNFEDLRSLTAITPWVDGVVLPGQPKDLIQQGRFNRVPVMIGNARDEGRLIIGLAYDVRRGSPLTEAEYQNMVTGLAGNATMASLVTSDYSSKRLGSPGLAASALITDSVYACGSQWTARALSGHAPTYVYEFQEPGPRLVADPYMDWGAYHEAELAYLFRSAMPTTPPIPALMEVATASQSALAAQMAQYWGRFAATGNPNGTASPSSPGYWPAFSSLWQVTQLLKASGVVTDLPSGVYMRHQCLVWDLAQQLGLGF
ncbi:MAG: carboxylesterase/lipase family protein [Aquabacterium sp.]